VLLAMPHDRDQALSALRLSLGRWTTRSDVERAAEAIASTVHRLLTPLPPHDGPAAASGLTSLPARDGQHAVTAVA
jgi:hypothetical protein